MGMEIEDVKRHIGKKRLIILKNSYKYTAVIPEFSKSSFTIVDIFGDIVSLDCSSIESLIPIRDRDDKRK